MSAKLQALTAKLNAEIDTLKADLEAAASKEQLVVGETYSISVGKGETARVIEATLVGQRVRENGSPEFRFSAGEGFDARFYDVSYNKVAVELEEGQVPSATIAKNIVRLENKRDGLAAKLEAQAARETLVDGETYEIKVGKGETAGVVRAVLLGQQDDEDGSKVFKFFYGSGFESTIVTCGIRRVVLVDAPVEEEDDGAPAETPEFDAPGQDEA